MEKKKRESNHPIVDANKKALVICDNKADSAMIYQSIISAIKENNGEIYIVVKRDGVQHFTTFNILPVYDSLSKIADEIAEQVNMVVCPDDKNNEDVAVVEDNSEKVS